MRLLHVRDFTFKQFPSTGTPPYAILSHRWADDELKLSDVERLRNTPGFHNTKIQLFAQYVQLFSPELEYIWVDTCCIDKSNAVEVSDAIDSMFNWYQNAKVCIAYMSDVHSTDEDAFKSSVWFERGWTLQELIAPQLVVFLNSDWRVIGHKGGAGTAVNLGLNLEVPIAAQTGIPLRVLSNAKILCHCSPEQKMGWMQGRSTLHEEDMAYAMYGIFNVALGAKYGEKQNAAKRLQEAINQNTDAWTIQDFSPCTAAIETATAHFASSLDDYYARALQSITKKGHERVHRLLQWLAYAVESPTIDQLLDVLIIHMSTNTIAFEERSSVQDLLSLLWPFVIVGDDSNEIEGATTIRLLHSSLQTYLESGHLVHKQFHLHTLRGHHLIEQICITTMLYYHDTKRDLPLLAYASKHWDKHTRTAMKDPDRKALNPHPNVYILQMLGDLKGSGDEDCGSVFQAACSHGSPNAVQILLSCGADVNAQGGFHGRPLQAASAGGHVEVVEMLLKCGADVDSDGTPVGHSLLAAAHRGNIAIVEILLASGADLDWIGPRGSAVDLAACLGNDDIVRLLLELGSDPNIEGDDYPTALTGAAFNGHTTTVRMLIDAGANVDIRGSGYTALHGAAQMGHTPIISMLSRAGATVDMPHRSGATPLYLAGWNGHLAATQELLRNNAEVDYRGLNGWTALMAACSQGHVQIVRVLIAGGADIQLPTTFGNTCLHTASDNGHAEVVKVLTDGKADLDAVNSKGETALHIASAKGSVEVIKLLLDAGAKVDLRDNQGGSAGDKASGGGHTVIVELLKLAVAEVNAVP